MTMLSGRGRGRFCGAVWLLLVGVAGVQTVHGLYGGASLIAENPVELELVYSRGETAPVLPRLDPVPVGGPRAMDDLVVGKFALKEGVPEARTNWGGTWGRWYTGAITNHSRFVYRGYVRVRFRDQDQREVKVLTCTTHALKPGERWEVRATAPESSVTAELLEIRGTGRASVTQGRNQLATGLLFGLLGFSLHVGLASWLRPRGWERRLLDFMRGE